MVTKVRTEKPPIMTRIAACRHHGERAVALPDVSAISCLRFSFWPEVPLLICGSIAGYTQRKPTIFPYSILPAYRSATTPSYTIPGVLRRTWAWVCHQTVGAQACLLHRG